MKEEPIIINTMTLKPSEIICKLLHLSFEKQIEALKNINRHYAAIEKAKPIEPIKKVVSPTKKPPPVIKPRQSGDCCPICGSINYFQSGTCKTCHDCSYAGGCG